MSETCRNIIVGYLAVMTLWMVHSLREYHCGYQRWVQGFNRLIPVGRTYDFNDFAGLIVCSLPFVWLLWRTLEHAVAAGFAPGLFRPGLLLHCLDRLAHGVRRAGYGQRPGVLGIPETMATSCAVSRSRGCCLDDPSGRPKGQVFHTV